MKLTAEQYLKRAALNKMADWDEDYRPKMNSAEEIETSFEDAEEVDDYWDALEDVRSDGQDTGFKTEYSRNYESKSIAAEVEPGIWVGWTYWYGGGKHGQPEEIEWMEHAYFVNVTTETRTVNVFARVEP